CSTPDSRRTRSSPCSPISPRASASAPLPGSSASPRTRSPATACSPATTPQPCTTNSWLFPPKTTEVQFDQKWSFGRKKQKHCRPGELCCGDCWDHVAFDPQHRLVLSVVVGPRIAGWAELLVRDVQRRTAGRLLNLMTSDEHPAYAKALREVYGQVVQPQRRGQRGRQPAPVKEIPQGLVYATVHKIRENNRV